VNAVQKLNNRRMRGFGAVTSAQESQVAGAAASAGASAIATGASLGAAAGPIGAAAGAIVGVMVGILTKTNNTASHIGSWDSQLIGTVNQLPSSVWGIGRQFPYNENSHGLVQMIEAALACGVYMGWDTSLISNYDVCANWAVTFGTAVQNVARTIFLNPPGELSVSIPLSPGAGGSPPFTFGFVSPNISPTTPLSAVGPDALSATIIMGKAGLMEAMMTALGGQNPGNISSNGVNPTAQKIFALMIDYWWGQYLPKFTPGQAPASVPSISSAISSASMAANTAATTGTNPQTAATVAATVATTPVVSQPAPPPVVATTTTTIPSTGAKVTTPVVSPSNTGALVSSLVASGTEPSDAIAAGNASLEANGIDSTAPASQAALQNSIASPGLSTEDWFLIGGGLLALLGVFYAVTRGR
jgi:hypothetical protein